MELDVYSEAGERTGTVALDESILGERVNEVLLHEAVVMYEARKRSGTHSTKTKDEVAGAGGKPWRQKHTGRARAGSRRSPLWRGGGITFGPKPRDYSYSMPKAARRAALRSALLGKLRDKEVRVIEKLSFEEPRTKRMVDVLRALDLRGSCLVAPSSDEPNTYKSVRNIKGVRMTRVRDLNAYAVLKSKWLLLTREAVEMLPEVVKK